MSSIIGIVLMVAIAVIVAYILSSHSLSLWKEDKTIKATLFVEAYGNKIIIEHMGGDPIYSAFDPPSWWDENWICRRAITITEQSGKDLKDYPLEITVQYDMDMNRDFSDLRFVDESNNKLDYWIQYKKDGKFARVWVKVDLPAHSTKTIYMYYGNPSATSESNPNAFSFDFFDDFSTDPSSRWRVYRNSNDVNNEFYWDSAEGVLYLTKPANFKGAFAFINHNVDIATDS